MILFKGATKLKKKAVVSKRKVVERDGIKCSCGAIEKYWTTLYYLHDKDCVINKEK